MKHIIFITLSIYLFTGCSSTTQPAPKPYVYPNYAIIKPEAICKPSYQNLQAILNRHLGKPYVWAEEGPDAFDCSGLTYTVYGNMGVEIPRIAREQAKIGLTVPFGSLQKGDMIFFGSEHKPKSKNITHVGIYLGKGWFAHASSKYRKVTVSNFDKEPEYRNRIKVCKRYLENGKNPCYVALCDAPITPMRITDNKHTTPWKKGMSLPLKAVPN